MVRYDAFAACRLAARWLCRRLGGATPSQQGVACRPTPFQRRRLNLLLDILDLTQTPDERPTSYELARRLIYSNATTDFARISISPRADAVRARPRTGTERHHGTMVRGSASLQTGQ